MSIFDKLFNKKIDPKERREKNNAYIKSKGINCYELLPTIESSDEVKLKDLDTICKRTMTCLISIQLSCDLREPTADKEQSKNICISFLNRYGLNDSLLDYARFIL